MSFFDKIFRQQEKHFSETVEVAPAEIAPAILRWANNHIELLEKTLIGFPDTTCNEIILESGHLKNSTRTELLGELLRAYYCFASLRVYSQMRNQDHAMLYVNVMYDELCAVIHENNLPDSILDENLMQEAGGLYFSDKITKEELHQKNPGYYYRAMMEKHGESQDNFFGNYLVKLDIRVALILDINTQHPAFSFLIPFNSSIVLELHKSVINRIEPMLGPQSE